MNYHAPRKMTVDEFLEWALDRPGRYELVNGVIWEMSPERAIHAETKAACYMALRAAIKNAAVNCFAMPDGMSVRITPTTAFEPDCLVYLGPRMDASDLEVPRVVVVVEVLSPGTKNYDAGAKLAGYFTLPELMHYLIIDPDEQFIVHHRRAGADKIETTIRRDGEIILDPPGLSVPFNALFADA